MKRFLVGVMIVLFGGVGLVLMAPPMNASALTDRECQAQEQTIMKAFFNFPTWYRGLGVEASSNGESCVVAQNLFKDKELAPIIFTIALNIIDIALRLAGLVAVGFVIWGGFHYTLAHGEPEQAKKAINIIRTALIGLVISMIATVVVSFLVARLGQSSSPNQTQGQIPSQVIRS